MAGRDVGELFKIFEKILGLLGKYKDQIITFTQEKAHLIKLRLHGKTISVIGPVAAGKTTLLHVLKDKNAKIDPMEYDKTTDPVQFDEKFKIEFNIPLAEPGKKAEVIKLKIRKPKDVGGEISIRDARDGWIDVCKNSDFIFYLIDSFNYEKDKSVQKRLADDFEWIANNAQAFNAGFKVVIFTNKMDKFQEDEEKKAWCETTIPMVEKAAKLALEPYQNHLALITPICLISPKMRDHSLTLALQYLADLD